MACAAEISQKNDLRATPAPVYLTISAGRSANAPHARTRYFPSRFPILGRSSLVILHDTALARTKACGLWESADRCCQWSLMKPILRDADHCAQSLTKVRTRLLPFSGWSRPSGDGLCYHPDHPLDSQAKQREYRGCALLRATQVRMRQHARRMGNGAGWHQQGERQPL